MQTNAQLPMTPRIYNPKVKGPRSAIHPELGRCSYQRLLVIQFGFSLHWETLAKLLTRPRIQACFHGFAELRFVQAPHCLAMISFSLYHRVSQKHKRYLEWHLEQTELIVLLSFNWYIICLPVPQLTYLATTHINCCNLKFALEWQ